MTDSSQGRLPVEMTCDLGSEGIMSQNREGGAIVQSQGDGTQRAEEQEDIGCISDLKEFGVPK